MHFPEASNVPPGHTSALGALGVNRRCDVDVGAVASEHADSVIVTRESESRTR
jgi:hypothetical protein